MGISRYEGGDFKGKHEKGEEPRRYNSLEELNRLSERKQTSVDDASPALFPKLTTYTNVRWRLGIVEGKDGSIPETEGVPRIFVMGKGKDGHDTMMSLKEAGIDFGSKEFWRQSQMGNVFAYPAGGDKARSDEAGAPRQLARRPFHQADRSGGDAPAAQGHPRAVAIFGRGDTPCTEADRCKTQADAFRRLLFACGPLCVPVPNVVY